MQEVHCGFSSPRVLAVMTDGATVEIARRRDQNDSDEAGQIRKSRILKGFNYIQHLSDRPMKSLHAYVFRPQLSGRTAPRA